MDKNKPMMMIIIALLVILLGTIVAVTFYLISAFGGNGDTDAPRATPTPLIMQRDIIWRELDEIRSNLQEPPPGRHNAHIVATFIVGVNGTASSRELSDFDLNFNYSVARSIADEVLFSSTYAQARSPEGRAAIEEQILSRLQIQFGPLVVSLRASDWVIP